MDVTDGLAQYFPLSIRASLSLLPENIKAEITEIRLRAEKPVYIVTAKDVFLLQAVDGSGPIRPDRDEIGHVFKKMCDFSLYSHQEEIAAGFITLRGGHRAGVVGTAVVQSGQITGLRDISAINLRVAREVPGAAARLLPLFASGPCSLLIAGAPASGKTTVLRDLLCQLCGQSDWTLSGISLIDERGEIAAVKTGVAQSNVGDRCDVLDGYPKAQGIQIALRCMAPTLIACDEIGGKEDVAAILTGANSGVRFLASAHAGSLEELQRRETLRPLLEAQIFDYIALLGGTGKDRVRSVVKVKVT